LAPKQIRWPFEALVSAIGSRTHSAKWASGGNIYATAFKWWLKADGPTPAAHLARKCTPKEIAPLFFCGAVVLLERGENALVVLFSLGSRRFCRCC